MAAAAETTTGTQVPEGRAGLPQMDVETFPSQVFWLVVTFGLLFIVLLLRPQGMFGKVLERKA